MTSNTRADVENIKGVKLNKRAELVLLTYMYKERILAEGVRDPRV